MAVDLDIVDGVDIRGLVKRGSTGFVARLKLVVVV